jgi:RNA polymerase sigma factor (sigma-70 family)
MDDPKQLYEQNLELINRIVTHVCRRNHVLPQDADDFRSDVHLHLLEEKFAILRKFEGKSSLSTYLTTVINRMLYQCRVEMWGKWRPTAEAKRLGDKAITIERMMTRDGLTLEETIQILTTGTNSGYTRAGIELLYAALPVRQQRPVPVPEEAMPELPAPGAADEPLLNEERASAWTRVLAELHKAIASLEDDEDQVILQMRFWHDATAPQIASALCMEQKKVYKRIAAFLKKLRAALQRAGIEGELVADLLAHFDPEAPK